MARIFLSTVSSLCSCIDQRVLTRLILVFLTIIAIGYPAIIDDVFTIKLPQFHGALPPMSPWWGLCLLLILTLGLQMHGIRALHDVMGPIDMIIWALICYLCLRDLVAYSLIDRIDSVIAWDMFWIYAIFLCLRMHSKSNDIDFLIIFATLSAVAIFAGSLMATKNIIDNITMYIFNMARPNWAFTNSISYCAATAAIIALHLLLRVPLTTGRRVILSLALCLNLFGIIINKSRTAFLCVILGLVIVLMARFLKGRSLPVIATTLFLCSAVLAVALARYWDHVEMLISLGRGILPETELALRENLAFQETSINIRSSMLKQAISLFIESPIFGHGLVIASSVKSEGFSLHGIPFIFLASYGLTGAILLALLALAAFPRRAWLGSWSVTLSMLLPFVAGLIMMSAVHLWYALPLLFLYHTQNQPGSSCDD